MVQIGPDTRIEGWDGCSGYHYSDSIIYGFSHTHLSGTGIGDYCDLLIMPFSGELTFNNGYNDNNELCYSSLFDKKNEMAKAGYYEVELAKHQITAKLTCTERVGIHKYSYKNTKDARLIIDLEHRDKLLDWKLSINEDNQLTGSRISSSWANKQFFYFCIDFSSDYQVEFNNTNAPTKAVITFKNLDKDELMVKVGISTVSEENAKNNLMHEALHWDFDQYRLDAEDSWRKQMDKIQIETNHDSINTIFYTSLYHSIIAPNLISDVDGSYRGTDFKIHHDDKPNYTVFSLWDTFRSTHPLYNILYRDKTALFLNTFNNQYKNGGQLPIWELSANYTGCMIGYHSVSAIVDAYAKGIKFNDYGSLYNGMLSIANRNILGIPSYLKHGYIPSHDESESVSKTLEYAYDDWCIAQLAKEMNDSLSFNSFISRAQSYKNIFNPETGFMQPKYNGTWKSDFIPSEVNFNYTEANGWQYAFFVPHDIAGLIEGHGGKDNFEQHLDGLFNNDSELEGRHQADITGLIGQYAHGNEPSHHMAYLYNCIGKPEKAQYMVHKILNDMYYSSPTGIVGNEDCGQMSSWYVLSAIGLFDINPGDPYYVIQTPLVNKASLKLENGNSFSIKKTGIENDEIYIAKVELNGKVMDRNYLHIDEIMKGGELVVYTTSDTSNSWSINDYYITKISSNIITPNPVIKAKSKTFMDTLSISMDCYQCDSILYGFGENNMSTFYKNPIIISNSTSINAVAYFNGIKSKIENATYIKHDKDYEIGLKNKYSNQYTGGGAKALIDGLTGPNNFMTGLWQGYHNVDFEAIVDLKSPTKINSISVGALQDIRSWIWFPKEVEFYVSKDGKEFQFVDKKAHVFPDNDERSMTHVFESKLSKSTFGRYVKVVAKNYGKCPNWHLGAGGDTWLFFDEIRIN
jgi:predicted alpha-1,2-mannosidase